MVILNLRSTLLGTHTLSSFELVTGCPVHLAPASFDLQHMKGATVHYCKGLIPSMKISHVLVERSSDSVFHVDEDLKQHILQTGNFVHWTLGKIPPERHSSTSQVRPLSVLAPNQSWGYQTPGSRHLESCDTCKEST